MIIMMATMIKIMIVLVIVKAQRVPQKFPKFEYKNVKSSFGWEPDFKLLE